MTPIFMWAGGKTKLLSRYAPHLPENFDFYHEPFFGGGAMFTWAYAKNPKAEFFINDINEPIMNIYRSLRDDLPEFLRTMDSFSQTYLSLPPPKQKVKLHGKTVWCDHPAGAKNPVLEKKYKLPGNKYNWHQIHKERPTRRSYFFKVRQSYQENFNSWSTTYESAVLYFLMKTAFNGVWQIGKGHGRFNTPCGLMRHDSCVYDRANLEEWSRALQKCTITSKDFKETMNDVTHGSYVFLDPPYRSASLEKKTFADYGTNLDDAFQEKVIDFFKQSCDNGSYSLLSNRDWNDNFFESRAGRHKIEYFDITYTVGAKKKDSDNKHQATKAREILMIGHPAVPRFEGNK